MTHSENASKLIQSFEGCRLTAYQDQGGVWTIGWGSTGPDITSGTKWTQQEADERFEDDLQHFDLALNCAISGVNQNQFDACLSLMYNIGPTAFEKSTVRREILAQHWPEAAAAFLMWDKVAGQVSKGLLRRREAEKLLFETPVNP